MIRKFGDAPKRPDTGNFRPLRLRFWPLCVCLEGEVRNLPFILNRVLQRFKTKIHLMHIGQ